MKEIYFFYCKSEKSKKVKKQPTTTDRSKKTEKRLRSMSQTSYILSFIDWAWKCTPRFG